MTVLPTLFANQQQNDLPLHEQLVRTLREAIRCQLHQLDCRQAELVGLRMALLRQD